MYVKRYIGARSRNHCCRQRELNITSSVCVSVVLATQHAKRMCRIVLPSVACPPVQYFSTLCHSQHYFRVWVGGGRLLNIKYAFFCLYRTFSILNIIDRDISLNFLRPSCKLRVILVTI